MTQLWKNLADQFQKSWANKLTLRRRLFFLKLRGDPVQSHIKTMTEIFEELYVIGDIIEEKEGRVIYLLGNLPDPFNMLVKTLKTNAEIPCWEIVMEPLLYEETKIKQKEVNSNETKAMTTHHISQQRREPPKSFQCGKYGHLNRYCRDFCGPEGKKVLLLKGTITQKRTHVT